MRDSEELLSVIQGIIDASNTIPVLEHSNFKRDFDFEEIEVFELINSFERAIHGEIPEAEREEVETAGDLIKLGLRYQETTV